MAKKNKLDNLDFLKDINEYVGTGGDDIWQKLDVKSKRDAMKPLANALGWASVFDGALKVSDERRAVRDSELSTYLAANPEIDESKLFGGISDQATELMKSGNMTYREVVKQLAGMNPMHEDYEGLTKQLNEINANAAQLKLDNEKLLGIKNEMANMSVDDLANMDDVKRQMYQEVSMGNGDNIQVVKGKLMWVDPNHPGTKLHVSDDEASVFDNLPGDITTTEYLSTEGKAGENQYGTIYLDYIDSDDSNKKGQAKELSWIRELTQKSRVDILTKDKSDYKGDTDKITKIQDYLLRLGYKLPEHGADGKWGDETQAAVDLFKKEYQGRLNNIVKGYREEAFGEQIGIDVEDYGVEIGGIDAEVPQKNYVASEKSVKLHSDLSTIDLDLSDAAGTDARQLNYRMTNFWRGLEDKELSSLIWDNDVDGELGWDGTMLSTRNFITDFIEKTTNATTADDFVKEKQKLMKDKNRNGFLNEFKKWYLEEYIKPGIGTKKKQQ